MTTELRNAEAIKQLRHKNLVNHGLIVAVALRLGLSAKEVDELKEFVQVEAYRGDLKARTEEGLL